MQLKLHANELVSVFGRASIGEKPFSKTKSAKYHFRSALIEGTCSKLL